MAGSESPGVHLRPGGPDGGLLLPRTSLAFIDGCASFDVMIHGELYAHVDLHVPGQHNMLNALAAASAAYVLGIPGQAVDARAWRPSTAPAAALSTRAAITVRTVYDDYAHHPGELHALLDHRPVPGLSSG